MTERLAGVNDIDFLVDSRLRFVDMKPEEDGYEELKGNLKRYYEEKLISGECRTVLIEDNKITAGMGSLFFYESIPSKENLLGINAYITSIFVDDRYRRQGIGTRVVHSLLDAARQRGCTKVSLSATEMGRKLYKKIGFQDQEQGMYYHL